MLKTLLFLFSLNISYMAIAQVYPYRDIKLEKPSDYTETEPMALSAATFLITKPFIEVDMDRSSALFFLNNWMLGNNKYTFYLKGIVEIIREDNNLLSLFIAAMAKYTLEHKAEAANPINVDMNAAKMVLAYSDDPKNNFKLKKKYRKILEKN